MKKHWAVVLPLLVVGCSGPQDANHDGIADGVLKPDSVSVVAPATPKGTVSGQVLDTKQQPISDVQVAMTIGSATTDAPVTAMTDAAGNFMFSNVPAGSLVLLTLTKDGYATMRASASVPAAAGNIPIDDGNASIGVVTLAEARSTVRFTLITPSGKPAVGAQGYVQALPSGISLSGSSSINSSVVGTAQADAQGVLTFTNMPSASDLMRIGTLAGSPASAGYQLWVDPIDLNGDGVYDSAGYSKLIPASDLANYGPSRIIELPQPVNEGTSGASFGLRVSNIPSLTGVTRDPLRNLLRSNEPLYLAFTQPVVKNSLVVTITDEAGVVGGTGTATANATLDAFTVTMPGTPSIQDGQHYNILLRATSAYDGSTISYKGYFISGDVKSPKTIDPASFATVAFHDITTSGNVGKLDAGECVIVTFNQVVIPPDVGAQVEAYLNTELGNASDKGEYNAVTNTTAAQGFPLSKIAPPFNVANCVTDTVPTPYPIDTSFAYTPRYLFTISTGGSVTGGIAPGTLVRLAFGKHFLAGNNSYETAWATPLISDVDVPLTIKTTP